MSGDGGAVVCILQEEYKDCPADYNLSSEYHTELNCRTNNLDWGAKTARGSTRRHFLQNTHLCALAVRRSRWHVNDKKQVGRVISLSGRHT